MTHNVDEVGRWALAHPLDLRSTLMHLRPGSDPTRRFAESSALWTGRWGDGPATIALRTSDGELRAVATGPGAEAALVAVPELVGIDDGHGPLLDADPPALARWARTRRDFRLGATRDVLGALLPTVLGQRVTATEAHASWSALVRRWGVAGPTSPAVVRLFGGPTDGLYLTPRPRDLARIAPHELHTLGIERARGDVLLALARRADRLATWNGLPGAELRDRLAALRGVGPWTAGYVSRRVSGDPDAVVVGDLHLPSTVAYLLAGEERATDERMLELLEPYRPHRGRLQELLVLRRAKAPRRGPRYHPLPIARL